MSTRSAAVAGTFYPGKLEELSSSVEDMLSAARTAEPCPKAVIAPHAGHIYSGPVAASVYARLLNTRHAITRVVLLGPSHRVGFRGIAATTEDSYETPLGAIPLDKVAVQSLMGLPGVGYLRDAHTQEHSLEVHLPFLQKTLGEFKLVPLVVGDASNEEVAGVLERLWGGPETLIVISTDLSHYHNYEEATKIDQQTCNRIVQLRPDLQGEQACGCRPVNGLLTLAKRHNMQVELVDLRNSGDTAGSRDRVVGYGAFVITEQNAARVENREEIADRDQTAGAQDTYSLAERQQMLNIARNAITGKLSDSAVAGLTLPSWLPGTLEQERATFVTLNKAGRLRGCIGSLQAHRPLATDIASNAIAAAFQDPRFPPLTAEEYVLIDIHISVLSRPEALNIASREDLLAIIRPGIDGLILEEGQHRSTYLPSVWEQLPEPEVFIRELRRKAGLDPDSWHQSTKIARYTTEEFC